MSDANNSEIDIDALVKTIRRGNTVILEKGSTKVRLFICEDWEYPEDEYLVSMANDFTSGHTLIIDDDTIKREIELYLKLGYKVLREEKGRPYYHCN